MTSTPVDGGEGNAGLIVGALSPMRTDVFHPNPFVQCHSTALPSPRVWNWKGPALGMRGAGPGLPKVGFSFPDVGQAKLAWGVQMPRGHQGYGGHESV